MMTIPNPSNGLDIFQKLSDIAFYDVFNKFNIFSYFSFLEFKNIDVPFII